MILPHSLQSDKETCDTFGLAAREKSWGANGDKVVFQKVCQKVCLKQRRGAVELAVRRHGHLRSSPVDGVAQRCSRYVCTYVGAWACKGLILHVGKCECCVCECHLLF